ncbi:MAG: transcriptional repressor [Anaerolineae bacterium]|nr:transcriptional repressor [Anaerolineae bacterium]
MIITITPEAAMPLEMSPASTEHWLEVLEAQGYRLTAPRRVVVEVIAQTDRALSPLAVFDIARIRYPQLGLTTVYRTLEKLEALGLVQLVHQANGCHTYIAAPAGHQHLLICEYCGRTLFFGGDDLGSLIDQIERESGYRVHEHLLQLTGTCPGCHTD